MPDQTAGEKWIEDWNQLPARLQGSFIVSTISETLTSLQILSHRVESLKTTLDDLNKSLPLDITEEI